MLWHPISQHGSPLCQRRKTWTQKSCSMRCSQLSRCAPISKARLFHVVPCKLQTGWVPCYSRLPELWTKYAYCTCAHLVLQTVSCHSFVSIIRKCVVHSGFEENEVSASSAVGAVCLPGSNHDVQCVHGVPEPLAGPGSGICTVVCRHCCGCGIVKQAGW